MTAPLPVIIDTDPGIDDLLAIWAALGSPLLDVRGLVSVHGNVGLPMAHRNLRALLAQASQSPGWQQAVPRVGRGATRPLVAPASVPIFDVHGNDGLGGIADRFPATQAGDDDTPAQVLYAELLESATEPVTLIALGPLTNIATLLAARPDLTDRLARIVIMGGGDGVGNLTPAAEFNVACDPEAAERVFSDTVPITMVGLDVTEAVRFERPWLAQLAAVGPCGTLAELACQRYLDEHESGVASSHPDAADGGPVRGMALHDAVAVAAAARPDLVSVRPSQVLVDHDHGPGRGATFVDPYPQIQPDQPARAQVDHVHALAAASVMDWVATSIGSLDQPTASAIAYH